MSERARDYWFPVKAYGYGWGLPVTWQGWLVFIVYLVLLIGGALRLRADLDGWAMPAWILLLTAIFVAVVVAKGERPLRWRWGRK